MLLELDNSVADRYNLSKLLTQFGECSFKNYSEFMKASKLVGKKTYLYYLHYVCIGTCSFILEPKFFHGFKYVAHVEDVVIDKEHRGRGLGKDMMLKLVDKIKSINSVYMNNKIYKIILDCNDSNVEYYEKIGFNKVENCMRLDIGEK